MAPPTHNLNAAKNGTRLSRLTLGELPPALTRVKRLVRQYRRDLEAACVEIHGEVSTSHAHAIDAACGQEQHAAVCRWLLNQRLDKMTISDIVSCSGQIAKAKASRNTAVAQLELDAKSDPWAALDALPYSPPTPPANSGNGQDHATGDATRDESDDSGSDDDSGTDSGVDATDDATAIGGTENE